MFYACFEASNTSTIARFEISPVDSPLTITSAEVRKTLHKINPRKAAGPDEVPDRVLRDCAHQLSSVMEDIFNISLPQATIPTCLKTSTIVPVPKASAVSCLNDYHKVALTPIVTKCFERLVMASVKKSINITTDSHQYAYRPNRSAADAIVAVMHTYITHLEKKNYYVRLLFLDFISAFNTIIAPSLCNWVLDFLTNRPQSVKINDTISSTIILNTGSPQGCILRPLLYTMLTHDCRAHCESNLIVISADNTGVVGLITNGDESWTGTVGQGEQPHSQKQQNKRDDSGLPEE